MPKQNTTIREWISGYPEIEVFEMPITLPGTYGLESWANLPHGTWYIKDVPDSILDEPFYPGFGTQRVPSFHAWSKDRVFFVWEYDGSTGLNYVLRNPSEITE